jgi:hypothetical protein
MQPTTPQPGQPGGPGSIRRAPTAAPPVIRTRQEAPLVQPRRPSAVLRMLEGLQNYILSEETLILVEFLVVVAIGIVVFVAVLHPVETVVDGIGKSISSLGLDKLLK